MAQINYTKEKVWEYLPAFFEALEQQLRDDDTRWGDTWKERPIEGQENRTRQSFDNYFDQYEFGRIPMPWLKIVGNALICWIREQEVKNGTEKN